MSKKGKTVAKKHRDDEIAVVGFNPGSGGIGRVMVNIVNGIYRSGRAVTLLLPEGELPELNQVDPGIKTHNFDFSNQDHAIDQVRSYIYNSKPKAILSNKDYSHRIIVHAVGNHSKRPKVVFRVGNDVVYKIKQKYWLTRRHRLRKLADLYRQADALIGNSKGVSAALKTVVGPKGPPIHTIYNPLNVNAIMRSAVEMPKHSWFVNKTLPIVINVARLAKAKDHATLIRAVAKVHAEIKFRLVILGDGRQRSKLLALAEKLGIRQYVDLPGFTTNPFCHVAKADVYVLSSWLEGLPNALLEALAIKIPVVATNCKSGPAEILKNGKYGQLVPVKQYRSMAAAIIEAYSHPLDPSLYDEAIMRFDFNLNVSQYLRVLI